MKCQKQTVVSQSGATKSFIIQTQEKRKCAEGPECSVEKSSFLSGWNEFKDSVKMSLLNPNDLQFYLCVQNVKVLLFKACGLCSDKITVMQRTGLILSFLRDLRRLRPCQKLRILKIKIKLALLQIYMVSDNVLLNFFFLLTVKTYTEPLKCKL